MSRAAGRLRLRPCRAPASGPLALAVLGWSCWPRGGRWCSQGYKIDSLRGVPRLLGAAEVLRRRESAGRHGHLAMWRSLTQDGGGEEVLAAATVASPSGAEVLRR